VSITFKVKANSFKRHHLLQYNFTNIKTHAFIVFERNKNYTGVTGFWKTGSMPSANLIFSVV